MASLERINVTDDIIVESDEGPSSAQAPSQSGGHASDYVALPGFPSVTDSEDRSVGAFWKRRNALILLSLCCVAAILYVCSSIAPEALTRSAALRRHTVGGEGADASQGKVKEPHRTSFHFQPEKNWMNDPNGPMYYKGYYHFFYQYNPDGAVWGNITWGHAVSTDLIQWLYLETALLPDQWYDLQGVWSGSVTMLQDGTPIIIYTGSSNTSEQVQNMAIPADPSDPLLRKWVKVPENPLIRHPPGIDKKDFRDPTTAWLEDDGSWRMTVGAKLGTTGLALLYKSDDLIHWELEHNILHAVPATGMWECVDFFPVSPPGQPAVEMPSNGPSTKHMLKVSLDDDKHDYYALGTYNTLSHTFVPDNPALDAGIGWRVDYGKIYASKTFFDPVRQRRILWGWANESDSEAQDIAKGWASVQAIPRTIWLDSDTGSNVLQAPIQEVNALRGSKVAQKAVMLEPGAVMKVDGATGAQLDIELVFDYPNLSTEIDDASNWNEHSQCIQGGSARRGTYGPFGLLVLADDGFREQTALYFYIFRSRDGRWATQFCSDHSRSSLLSDIDTTVLGSYVQILPTESFLSVRVLVDSSIVESFVQGGRMAITSRVYPTMAIDSKAHLFLFNNATTPVTVRSIDVWKMNAITMHAI